MRILLNTIPRAASKWLHRNLLNYLDMNAKDESIREITNWFEVDTLGQNDMQGNIVQKDQKFYFTENKNFNINTEMAARLDMLLNYNSNIIVKIHPVGLHALIAIEKLKRKYDLYYTLSRKDKVEQIMSMLVSQTINIYSPGKALNNKIIETINQPISLDFKKAKSLYLWLESKESYMFAQKANKHLYFEDLITLKNSYDFCDYLGIPIRDFELSHAYGIEYGVNKNKMVNNYDDIKKYVQLLPQIIDI